MSRVRSTNTRPELRVRKLVHQLGFRFRLHRHDLPGTPDLVFPTKKAVVFVNGCFWHSHKNCPNNRKPRTRKEYWLPKLRGNVARDRSNYKKLGNLGWRVLVIWECEIGDVCRLREALFSFLRPKRRVGCRSGKSSSTPPCRTNSARKINPAKSS
jgi:DNA mismatch endonuclease (patch repair protein)